MNKNLCPSALGLFYYVMGLYVLWMGTFPTFQCPQLGIKCNQEPMVLAYAGNFSTTWVEGLVKLSM